MDLLTDEPGDEPDEFDPEEGQDDIRLDDLDPDIFDTGMPDDF